MKLNADFYAVPEGEVYPRTFKAGEECPASLQSAARQLGLIQAEHPANTRKTKVVDHSNFKTKG